MAYVGIDTSNYTTSLAVFDGEKMVQKKKMLLVKEGEKGIRQSEALFQHTVNLPALFEEIEIDCITAVGVSARPRNKEGSYMPCFLAGESAACALAKGANTVLYKTSHQVGHILAALYSANKLELKEKKFVAFHLSGGTTEALLVKPDKDEIITAEIVSQSLDLKAGQAVDRAGVMLGMSFPCGKELDLLSQKSEKEFKIKPSMKGSDCSLSGVENKAKNMLLNGEAKEDIAKYVLSAISQTVLAMLDGVLAEYGELPVIFSGGVSSNSLLRKTLDERKNVFFAEPEYSLDNAAGVALFAYLKDKSV